METSDKGCLHRIVELIVMEVTQCSPTFVSWLYFNGYMPDDTRIEADTKTIISGILSRDRLVVEHYHKSRMEELIKQGSDGKEGTLQA